MVNLQERKKSTQHAPVYVTKNFLLKIPNIINLCTLGTALLDYLFLGLGTVSSSTVPSSSNSLSAFFFFFACVKSLLISTLIEDRHPPPVSFGVPAKKEVIDKCLLDTESLIHKYPY